MAYFISNAITDRGRILLGEAQVGATLEATKIVMGSGYIPSGSTAATMTAVVAPVIELEINKKKRAGDGTVTFGGAFSNETITEAFYFREFALFARVQYADGTYSDEALYSYGNAGGNADLIPAYSTSTVVEKQMDIVVYVGNETQVNLTVASGLYNAHAEKHAADGEDPITPEMIGAVLAKPLGSYGVETTIAEQVQYWFERGVRWGVFHVALCSDLPPETIDCDHGIEFKVLSGYRLEVTATSLSNENYQRHYDAYSKAWITNWGRVATMDIVMPETIGAAKNYGFIIGVDLLEWATAQTVGGMFLLNNDVTGVPNAAFWHGVLTVGETGGDKGIFIFNETEAYSIATASTSFDNSKWLKFTLVDSLPVEVATAEIVE